MVDYGYLASGEYGVCDGGRLYRWAYGVNADNACAGEDGRYKGGYARIFAGLGLLAVVLRFRFKSRGMRKRLGKE